MNRQKDIKSGRLRSPQAAKVRERGLKVGREYCIVWQGKGGRKAPKCKSCHMVKFGKDCTGNAVGYRDYIMSKARAEMTELLLLQEKNKAQLTLKGVVASEKFGT